MTRQRYSMYGLLLAASGLFTAAAIATLVPNAGASWENILGYKSLCTFAPIATALCALLAGMSCTLRRRLFGPRSGQKLSPAAPIIVGLALAAVIAFSLPAYTKAKVDANSGATAKTESAPAN